MSVRTLSTDLKTGVGGLVCEIKGSEVLTPSTVHFKVISASVNKVSRKAKQMTVTPLFFLRDGGFGCVRVCIS